MRVGLSFEKLTKAVLQSEVVSTEQVGGTIDGAIRIAVNQLRDRLLKISAELEQMDRQGRIPI